MPELGRARRRHVANSDPWPVTASCASHAASRQRSAQASSRRSNPFRRSPSAPTKRATGRSSGHPSSRLEAARSSLGHQRELRSRRIRNRRRGFAPPQCRAARARPAPCACCCRGRARARRERRSLPPDVIRMREPCVHPTTQSGDLRLVRAVDVVHPRTSPASALPPLAITCTGRSRRAWRSPADATSGAPRRLDRAAGGPDGNVTDGCCARSRPRPVRDEVHAAGALAREMHRERVVGAIHPAERREVACDQQPVAHTSCSP